MPDNAPDGAPDFAPDSATMSRLRCVLVQVIWLLLLATVILLWGGSLP